jgi:hypothetical protein
LIAIASGRTALPDCAGPARRARLPGLDVTLEIRLEFDGNNLDRSAVARRAAIATLPCIAALATLRSTPIFAAISTIGALRSIAPGLAVLPVPASRKQAPFADDAVSLQDDRPAVRS